ncbi:transferase [Pyrenochaeta sp. MPI-SDFR-AT-0127]|nr:transferase [Pyrenochaeta sp. MPI-SDFR-AT-0127]
MPSRQEFALSPLDQHGPKLYTRMALVFPVTDYEPAIAVLQAALEKTCDQFPYLKGSVSEKDLSERKQSFLIVSPSDATPRFEERPAPSAVSSYPELRTNRTPFPPEIFPSPALTTSGSPVLGASYTKIEGGLVVCIVTNHKVIDGTGYSEILRILAHNARIRASESTIPTGSPDPDEIHRRRLRILGGKTEVPKDVMDLTFEEMLARHPEYTLKSKKIAEKAAGVVGTLDAGTGTNKVFAFSGSKIEAVKHTLADKLPSRYLTVNNILTAIIWASITHVRATRPEGALNTTTSKMDYSVSGRRLVGASLLDPPFLGNAICYAQAEKAIKSLSFSPFSDKVEALIPTIDAIASASDHLTASHMASLVHLSDTNPDLSDMTMSWLFNGPGDLHFISWAQVGVYELDFGSSIGRPGYMRSAFMKLNGVVTFLPRRRADRDKEEIEVSVLLREDDMERLAGDAAWRSWLVDG